MKLHALAGAIGALGALLFGATPATTHAQTAPSPRVEPGQKVKPLAKVRTQTKLFKNEREREKWCETAEAWAASIAQGDRTSRKRQRWLELQIAATRNPSIFERRS